MPPLANELGTIATVATFATLSFAAALTYHHLRPTRTQNTFLGHWTELRTRLAITLIVFATLTTIYFTTGLRTLPNGWLVPTFGLNESTAAHAFQSFATRLVPPGVVLIVTRPVDAVLAQMQITLFLAFATTFPLMAYETAMFLAPALQPRERRALTRAMPLVGGLFAGGALFGYLVMAPLMVTTLYEYAPGLGATPFFLVQELVGFTTLILIVCGLAFELPALMYALTRFNLVPSTTYQKYWRHAIILLFLAGGILTPDPSMVSQAIVSIPLVGLFLVGIGLSKAAEK